jgi:UDP-N-acetylmuramoyl-tripeptide--D-alanyl-D-alanine ligase
MHQFLPVSKLVNVDNTKLDVPLKLIATDSRKINKNDFFIAICGEKFDGNQFLDEIFKKGAIAALASNRECIPQNCPVLLVKDTLIALQQIAKQWRMELNPIATLVTGSNGKTTVKEMIASIFSEYFGQEHYLATFGNLNNEIGLPLTLLGLHQEHQAAVIELGMNHPGETQFLANITQPNIVLINNAQREHQEFMHTVEAVAVEHGDAIKALQPKGTAVFPADSEYTKVWRQLAQHHQYIDFELIQEPHISDAAAYGYWIRDGLLEIQLPRLLEDIQAQVIQVRLSTLGDHNAKNAIAAAAVAHAVKVDRLAICRGLEKFKPVHGRMQSHELPSFGKLGWLIDDSYNANPDSVIAAIDVLAKLSGRRWLILGDMGEVGDKGDVFHEEIGIYAKRKGIHHLYATGELAIRAVEGFQSWNDESALDQKSLGLHFKEPKALLKYLKHDLQTYQSNLSKVEVAVLVKGSRFTKMERIVNCLLKEESLCF